MSEAYEDWVLVERDRLNLSILMDKDLFSREPLQEAFDRLTVENKKRRLLFAKGRKEPLRKPRRVR